MNALAVLCAFASSSPGVELVAELDATPLAQVSSRNIGEPRFMAVSQLLWDDKGGFVQVLDLDSRELIRVQVARDQLAGKSGRRPRGQLVSFESNRVGLLLQNLAGAGAWTSRYVELDPETGGRVTRSVELGDYSIADLQFLGTDPMTDIAWMAIVEDHPQLPEMRQLVLRSLNLQTLSISDHVKVPMRRRTSKSGYETWLQFHPSPDFSRFAAVEYAEDGIEMDQAKVWVIDVQQFSWFDIDAPSTAYSAVFSGDRAHLYLVSNQHGSLSRVDIAARRVDKKAFGLKAAHHLGIALDSGRLYAVGSSVYHASVRIPDLGRRRTGGYAPAVRQHMRHLFGSGAVSFDGRYLVVEGDYSNDAIEPRKIYLLKMR